MPDVEPALPVADPRLHRVPPLRLAAVATLVMLLLYFTAQITQLLNPGFGVWFTEVVVFLGMASVVVRLSGRHPVIWTGAKWSGLLPSAFGFGVGVANYFALAIPLQALAMWIFPESWSQHFDGARILKDKSPADLALIISAVVIAAPIAEEYFFRGVLQNAVAESERFSRRATVVLVAMVFSAFHFDPVGFVARVELGILFGWLLLRTGSIWPSVMAHAANNLTTVVLFVAAGGAEGATGGSTRMTSEQAQQMLVFAVLGLLALAGLAAMAAKVPSVLARRVEPDPVLPPPRSFFRLAAPWALIGTVGTAALFLFDHRGVALNWFDGTHPLPPAAQEAKADREALSELRRQARAGEVSLDAYRAERKAIIERYGGKPEEKRAPEPKPLEPAPVPEKT